MWLLDSRIAIQKKGIIMTVEQAILENVKVLSPDQQQEVLAFIKFLQSDRWENIYQGRFKELQQEIRLGIDAVDRGEVIDAEDMFRNLRLKLQQRRAQAE
jgi:antitoxin ParD1/3/4